MIDHRAMGTLLGLGALGWLACRPAPPPPAPVPIPAPSPVPTEAAPPPAASAPTPAEPPCPEVAPATLTLSPKKHEEADKTPFTMAGRRLVARKAVRAHWVETGVAVLDDAIREEVDLAGLKTVFADSDLTTCIAEGDEGGCVASVSLSVTHDDGRLLSLSSTTNLHNAMRTSYATTLITFAFDGTTWRRLQLGDVVPNTEAFFDAHRCYVEADQGWALVEGAFETYDATSFGKQRCTFALEELAAELGCPLRDLAKKGTKP